jgi:hypothetical protein
MEIRTREITSYVRISKFATYEFAVVLLLQLVYVGTVFEGSWSGASSGRVSLPSLWMWARLSLCIRVVLGGAALQRKWRPREGWRPALSPPLCLAQAQRRSLFTENRTQTRVSCGSTTGNISRREGGKKAILQKSLMKRR